MRALLAAPRRCSRALATAQRRAESALAGALERAVTADAAAQLTRTGYAVVDNVFGAPLADTLRQEVLALKAAGLMAVNATHLVRGGVTERLEKRGVWEAEAHALGARGGEVAPTLTALSRDRTLLTLLTVYLETSRAEALQYQVLKAQVNEGGGACFPIHADTEETLDTRQLTALVYLNPAWEPAHGGELVLYPLPAKRVVIEPRHDRLVLFRAPRMLHRILPSYAEQRVCFTLWLFSRDELRKKASPTVSYVPGPATLERLLHPSVAQHTAKAVLRDEWAASILQAHGASPAREAALATFHAEVAVIERVLEQRHPGAGALLEQLRREHSS